MLSLSRELDPEVAEEDEQADRDEPQREHEPGPFRVPELLERDLAPEDNEARQSRETDDDHGGQIDRPLERPAHQQRRCHDHREDRDDGHGNAESSHGARVRFRPWTAPGTTTRATTTSSSSSATGFASTRRTSSSASRQPPSSSACWRGTSSTTTRRPTWSSSSSGTESKSPAVSSAATSFATGPNFPSSRASRSSTG